MKFVGAVEAFDELFEGSEARRDRIKVLKSDDVVKREGLRKERIQEMDGVLIRGVAVGDEDEFLVGLSGSDGFFDGDGSGKCVAGGVEVIGGNF